MFEGGHAPLRNMREFAGTPDKPESRAVWLDASIYRCFRSALPWLVWFLTMRMNSKGA